MWVLFQRTVNNEQIIHINHFKHVSSWINESLDQDEEMKTRMQIAEKSIHETENYNLQPSAKPTANNLSS